MGVVEPTIFVSVSVYGVLPTTKPLIDTRAPGGCVCSTVELPQPVNAPSVMATISGKRLPNLRPLIVMLRQ